MLKTSGTSMAIRIALNSGMSVTKDGVLVGAKGAISKAKKVSGNGYLMFSAYDEQGKQYKGLVHQLQAYLKYGEIVFTETSQEIHVRHLNGNPLDNSWDNIALGSQSDNFMDRPLEMRLRCASRAAYAKRVISVEDIRTIRAKKAQGLSLTALSKEYGKSKGHLSDIVNRKLYKDII